MSEINLKIYLHKYFRIIQILYKVMLLITKSYIHNIFKKKNLFNASIKKLTLLWGRTMKAPPPADSTMMARNLGFTAQNVESHELLDTLMLS